MSALQIPGHISQRIIDQARAGAPFEVCGILGGKGNIVSLADPSAPEVRSFRIAERKVDSEELKIIHD
jgi:proteasome lid subunit RPN8/RPN11